MAAISRPTQWREAGAPDFWLVALTLLLTVVGVVAVYSSSFVIALADFGDPYYYVIRQIIWAAIGGVGLILISRMDYRRLRALAVPVMFITVALLIVVLLIGLTGNGAQRWIGAGPVTLQPAEFAKLSVIIYLAAWLAGRGERVRTFEHGLIPFLIIVGIVGGLIMLQPNLGTTLIILAITMTMFWVGGASIRHISLLAVVGVVVVFALAMLSGYRSDRITTFLHPGSDSGGSGFQTLQSLIAIGNGGIHGLGLGASRAKFFYIPESHTDGVFAIIGEELGLLATVTLIILFVTLMYRGFQLARRTEDEFGRLLATGITTWIAVQALLNIGGITSIIPLTGVPLPFLSYGSNALTAVLLAMGILISISRYQPGVSYRQSAPVQHVRRIVKRVKR
ncbi:MAG TPA: putative lipid II flippase FtsW [Tepidiformaceae bacterium]|nr:putative lipid II flippase FtsW [Tepidiformaceae bacterium]